MYRQAGATLPESGSIWGRRGAAWDTGQRAGSQPWARTHRGEVVFCAVSQAGL